MADEETPQTEPGTEEEQPTAESLSEAEEAMESVEQAAAAVGAAAEVALPAFDAGGPNAEGAGTTMHLLDDVNLQVKLELGRTTMYVEDVLRLNAESVIELDKAAGDPVDVYVNDRHVARGEVLVLNENFCVRVSEIIPSRGSEEPTG